MNQYFSITDLSQWLASLVTLAVLPFLLIGTIRKTKARMQNRIGPPLLQPFFDIVKLFRKSETVSDTTSWLFRMSGVVNVANVLVLALLVPWLCYKPMVFCGDLFLIVYLFALGRLFTMLSALDTGSAFGAFGSSRDATLAMLVEPASLLSLVSLGSLYHTSDLNVIFSSANNIDVPGLWLLVGTTIILASLVELSRMPIDDPTTHLELTMIHEAMILEFSGRNLALMELARAMRMTVLFGLASHCFVRAIPGFENLTLPLQGATNIAVIISIAFSVALFESVAVKLQWRKVPEFIAYCMTLSLLAGMLVVAKGVMF